MPNSPDVMDASWYVVHTKPKQELRALEQLENQGYTCFLPTLEVEKLRQGKIDLCLEPLFARYLFIQLSQFANNWAPIRSTRGVSSLVSFGGRFASLPDELVEQLRNASLNPPRRLFEAGDKVTIASGPLADLEGIYQISDGEVRAMVLIELMSQQRKLSIAVDLLRRAA